MTFFKIADILYLRTGLTSIEIYNAVLLCTGHYVDPYIPPVKGLKDFKYGRILHCRNYKDFHGYEDKRVIVVGMGNSGCDVAVELCQVASKVNTVRISCCITI